MVVVTMVTKLLSLLLFAVTNKLKTLPGAPRTFMHTDSVNYKLDIVHTVLCLLPVPKASAGRLEDSFTQQSND
jgi:hypothetical protein